MSDNETLDQVMALIADNRRERAERLPDEAACFHAIHDAVERLRELGWKEAQYCPKDGSKFYALELGMLGYNPCVYSGDWPKGTWWVYAGGDMWPSRPVMFKPIEPDQQEAAK